MIKSLDGAGYLGNLKVAEERKKERYIENKKRGEMPS
jgi:hypothetical protein